MGVRGIERRSQAHKVKHANVRRVESLDVYADGRRDLWHLCQYFIWDSLLKDIVRDYRFW